MARKACMFWSPRYDATTGVAQDDAAVLLLPWEFQMKIINNNKKGLSNYLIKIKQ